MHTTSRTAGETYEELAVTPLPQESGRTISADPETMHNQATYRT